MIKIYVMESCPDCQSIMQDVLKRSDEFEVIDIGEHVKKLKEFIHLRDSNSAFDEIKEKGNLGIPCFVKENGEISFDPNDFGIKSSESIEDCCDKGVC